MITRRVAIADSSAIYPQICLRVDSKPLTCSPFWARCSNWCSTGAVQMGSIKERKTKNGKAVYDAAVRRLGQKKIYRTFLRLTDARNWVLDTESDIRNGRYQAPQVEPARHILTDAIERYMLDELPKKPLSIRDQTRHLHWFKERAGRRLLCDITPALLTELKSIYLRSTTRFKKPPRPQSWNRYISSLSCVLQCCVRD